MSLRQAQLCPNIHVLSNLIAANVHVWDIVESLRVPGVRHDYQVMKSSILSTISTSFTVPTILIDDIGFCHIDGMLDGDVEQVMYPFRGT